MTGLHDYVVIISPWLSHDIPPVLHGDIMGYIGEIVTMYVDLWLDPAISLGPQEFRIEQLGRSAGLVHRGSHGSHGSVASVVLDVIENGPKIGPEWMKPQDLSSEHTVWMGQRNPAPVDRSVVSIPLFCWAFYRNPAGAGFRNHPQYGDVTMKYVWVDLGFRLSVAFNVTVFHLLVEI